MKLIREIPLDQLYIGMICRHPTTQIEYDTTNQTKYEGIITEINNDMLSIQWETIFQGQRKPYSKKIYSHENCLYGLYEKLANRKPIKQQKIYPHKCPFCTNPSRNSNMFTICSNNKCKKSHKKLKQLLQPDKLFITKTSKEYIYIKCVECAMTAVKVFHNSQYGELIAVACPNQHNWLHRLEIGNAYLNEFFELKRYDGHSFVNFTRE